MRIIKVSPNNPERSAIEAAAEVLQQGGLIIYPTDTAYGLGGNALKEAAVRRVLTVKGRPENKPIHVVVRDLEMIEDLVEVNPSTSSGRAGLKLIDRFWPGPLTLIFKKKGKVPSILVGGGETLGVRLPNCLVTKEISRLVDFPYTATSANPSGGGTAYSVEESLRQFNPDQTRTISLVLDAQPLPRVLPSTVVDVTFSPPRILREGPVSRAEIEKILSELKFDNPNRLA